MPPEHCHAELAGRSTPATPTGECQRCQRRPKIDPFPTGLHRVSIHATPTNVTNLPAPHDIVRMTCLLREHQRWSSVWDPR